ncbi:MAG: SRPBCC family protein [Novosphingobium sp.]|nr:SRPBCC family protein [Novosphingobium sp.]
MIETEQSVTIAADIGTVWTFARDIRRWAGLMPGMQECEIVDDDNSRWTLKVGVGGLVRTVRVAVHVEQWDEPEQVLFAYRLEGDPVQGGGSYRAIASGTEATEVTLHVRVEGGGPMAPMWEAMGRPLLPQLAKGFAGQLKAEIEKAAGMAEQAIPLAAERRSWLARVFDWLRRLWRPAST